MLEKAKTLIKNWVKVNTFATAHPCDQERFMDLVIELYKSGEYDISEDDFREVVLPKLIEVVGAEFAEEKLNEFYSSYFFGISLLKYVGY